jgi:hypothetical protein
VTTAKIENQAADREIDDFTHGMRVPQRGSIPVAQC